MTRDYWRYGRDSFVFEVIEYYDFDAFRSRDWYLRALTVPEAAHIERLWLDGASLYNTTVPVVHGVIGPEETWDREQEQWRRGR
jgi:hypothetical protein